MNTGSFALVGWLGLILAHDAGLVQIPLVDPVIFVLDAIAFMAVLNKLK